MVQPPRLRLGQLIYSKAGRDQGRFFLVVKIEGDRYILIADGDLRKIEDAKKKNIRHVTVYEEVAQEIARKLEAKERVTNEEIQHALEMLAKKYLT